MRTWVEPRRCGEWLLRRPQYAVLPLIALVVTYALSATGSEPTAERHPTTAVVFTGQFKRVDKGLELLERGEIERLLISGVNQGAGIRPDAFERQFGLSDTLLQARREGRIVLGTRAQSTIENGAETACWIEQEGLTGPLLLITSNRHLERATAALQNMLPDLEIVGLGVEDTPRGSAADQEESRAFVATKLLGLLPRRMYVPEGLADCSEVDFR